MGIFARTLPLGAGSLFLLLGSAAPERSTSAQDPAPPAPVEEEGPRRAEAAELATLQAAFQEALASGSAQRLAEQLQALQAYDNPELLECAKAGLAYKASKLDKSEAQAEAKELGRGGADELARLVAERESLVQAAAARLCQNLPGAKTEALLLKAVKEKDLAKSRPKACAAVILALGALGCDKAEDAVGDELFRMQDLEVARAAVRYFGQVKTKDERVVRFLCENLDPPAPADVQGAANPPASYWEARWKVWNAIRRDVAWSLKEITGQAFQPADGDKPGDGKRALAWLREHGKEKGIR